MRCNLYLYDGGVLIVNRYLKSRPTDADIREIMRMRSATSAKLTKEDGLTVLATF